MRKFISMPNHFRGLGDNTEMFTLMINNNTAGFNTVFTKAEELFKRLLKVQDQFKDWVVLGTVDLNQLIDKNLFVVPDWEKNFKALKGRGREAEKLPT